MTSFYNSPYIEPKMGFEALKKGQNPRKVFGARHRERGPKLMHYTYEDVGELLGLSVKSVRNLGKRVRTLAGVVGLIMERRRS